MEYDIIVVGGGHAGCEASLAASRMGAKTLLLTMNLDTIAQMSCNPAIGGLAKGQLVREVDALGGEMGKVIDATAIQFRMLNQTKGHAVRSPRAQADKKRYQFLMKKILEEAEGLTIRQEIVEAVLTRGRKVIGVGTQSGLKYRAKMVILTTGTFLRGLIHMGDSHFNGGRAGELSAMKLSSSLKRLGLELGRLKTGTPPRVNGRTIDFDACTPQHGDPNPRPFSFSNKRVRYQQVPCYITYTNQETHDIIRKNLDRSPLFQGRIKGIGPRYCPSIEDKVVRFPDKERHQIFLEPEGLDTYEYYCNGISTSLPQDVQVSMCKSIDGLKSAEILRFGYAVEYDFAPPTQLKPSLETKRIENLFLAGQINGTSGYEEAAAQGILAGINAVLRLRGGDPFILNRPEAYIGVLLDDLTVEGTNEPYRMFTSRAEYRLLLRQDNADRRLLPYGVQFGLIPEERLKELEEKERKIREIKVLLKEKKFDNVSLEKYLRRPGIAFRNLEEISQEIRSMNLDEEVKEQVEIEVKYEGYIARQKVQVDRFLKLENLRIPQDFDYSRCSHIRKEAREKLARFRPISLGQASRISGVSPADISILMIILGR